MAADDRFYQMSLTNRPLFWGDLGNRFSLSGFVLEGEDTVAVILSPNAVSDPLRFAAAIHEAGLLPLHPFRNPASEHALILRPSVAEWWEIIRASDDPSVFILDGTGGIKAIHRKMRYVVSGAVQQKVWARDEFRCLYCGQRMGRVQLSIDHFEPLELGGHDDPTNYASACRSDNKKKGAIPAREWCDQIGVAYEEIAEQLRRPLP